MVHSKRLQQIIDLLIHYRDNKINSTGIFSSIKNDEIIKKEIIEATSFLSEINNITLGQRLYHIRENIYKIDLCVSCKENPRKFHRLNVGYFPTCGNKECKKKSKVNSFKNTIKEKYGETYFKEGSKSREKYKETMLEKYGVDHNFKSKEIRDSIEKNMIKKYGKPFPLSNPEILDKRNKTCINKYGDLNFIQSKKSKETNIFKYGDENAMKNPEISKKVTESSSETKRLKLENKLKNFNIFLVEYNNIRTKLYCNICKSNFEYHPVTINAKIRAGINSCPKCNPPNLSSSKSEDDFFNFISSFFNGVIEKNCRYIFKGNNRFSEVDLYLPDLGIAFEYNGLYWHSEIYKDKLYHKEKTEYLLKLGIKLYHIWEDDWIYNNDLVRSMVISIIGGEITKIYARKCEIKYVNQNEYKEFCEKNHLKGYSTASKIIGLYYNKELLSLMSFSKTRKLIESGNSPYEYELIRSCSKKYTIIIGGASKILSFFFKNVAKSLVTYCDVSFSPDPQKTVYKKCGMTFNKITDPGYYWIIDGKRSNRLNWTKSKLIKLGYPPEMTADEIMEKMGAYKIWDCGNYKFSLKCD